MLVTKRNGNTQEFSIDKIYEAIHRCSINSNEYISSQQITDILYYLNIDENISVENIQDQIENILMEKGYFELAKHYILHRDKKKNIRENSNVINIDIEELKQETKFFPNSLSSFVYKRTYSKFLPEFSRREMWTESIQRLIDTYNNKTDFKLEKILKETQEYLLDMKVVGSMRALSMAGPALDRCNICAYNCSYLPIDSLESFSETMYLLLSGAGVGFSVEYECIDKLPRVKEQKNKKTLDYTVEDSSEGWCNAFLFALQTWFSGLDVVFNYDLVRPAGARLYTKGGFSSGPLPLKNLLEFSKRIILSKQGRRLDPIDAHDIVCMIGEAIVSGGSRRSALISLSDFKDNQMKEAKNGKFWVNSGHRSNSNNSYALEYKPDISSFMDEWINLMKSGSGERGIFSRYAAELSKPKRRKISKAGTNPCFTGDMKLLTTEGYKSFKELCDTDPEIINYLGNKSQSKVWCSGKKNIIQLEFENKNIKPIKCTPNHTFLVDEGEMIYEENASNLIGKYVRLFGQDTKTTKVISIKTLGKQKVYDFTEPITNWGIVNGVVVHNCAEIILRPYGLCNLSEIILREDDTWEDIFNKAYHATVIGTIQSTFTDFKYLRDIWKKNAEEERLLGVSLTGQLDNKIFIELFKNPNNQEIRNKLKELKEFIIKTNIEISEILGINPSVCTTAVKPSGNTSQLANSSSGCHPRYSKYYIRRVRINANDPIVELCRDSGIKLSIENGQTSENVVTYVVSFPTKAPEGCLTRNDFTALQQLEYWLALKDCYAEHSISCTVYVDESDWLEVGSWVYKNLDKITGLSFLPKDNSIYQQSPYEEITEEEYNTMMESFIDIPWTKLHRYEKSDTSVYYREFSCVAGSCELL